MSQRQTRARAQSQTTTVLTDDNISDMLIRYIRRFQDYIPLPSDLSDVPIGDWDVSEVTDMSNLFYGLETFNEPLNDWNVSNVTNMESMFEGATSFNQPLDRWDVSNVRNMRNMFKNTSLSQDPNWNISPNVNTRNMFQGTPLARQRRGRAQRAPAAAAQPPPPPAEAPAPRARQTRRAAPAVRPPPPPPAEEPGGVAFEIHNAFDRFKLNEFIDLIKSKSNFMNRDRPLQPLIDNINANPANSAEVKRDLTAKINRIFTTLREYGGYNTNIDKITFCIQYVLMQPQEFIDAYIQTLITDCLKAYSSGRQESCVKGVYERIFYSFRDTIATICLDQMQGTGASPLCKPEYITLFEFFYETWPKEGPGGLNEYMQEWYGDGEAVSALSPENRIESFVDFVRNKINNAARFRQAEASIRRYANEDLNAMFGGRRKKRVRKTIKKRQSKRARKTRRH
jgi:surface protein